MHHHRSSLSMPYGFPSDGSRPLLGTARQWPRCINAQPGQSIIECDKPARWVGFTERGHAACFCDHCKENGWEARQMTSWLRIEDAPGADSFGLTRSEDEPC